MFYYSEGTTLVLYISQDTGASKCLNRISHVYGYMDYCYFACGDKLDMTILDYPLSLMLLIDYLTSRLFKAGLNTPDAFIEIRFIREFNW